MLILNEKLGMSACETLLQQAEILERRRQRRNELWIITCYVQWEIVEEFVSRMGKIVRLTDVYLAFNYSELLKFGAAEAKEQLDQVTQSLRAQGIEFQWAALYSPSLMHGKAYAVIQRSNNEIVDGFSLITSANFTRPGFFGKNVELGALLTKKKEIRSFEAAYDTLWHKLSRDTERAISDRESVLFKYALISKGVFLHKWSGNLRQDIAIKYELTNAAKERGSIAPELAQLGFDAGNGFSRQIVDLGEIPSREISRSFVTQYTIETYWGRWCPLDAWQEIRSCSSGSEKFIEQFQKATNSESIEALLIEAKSTQNRLIEEGWIKPVSESHLDNWSIRIKEIRHNVARLERYYNGYDDHRLPYSIDQKSELNELFESMLEEIKRTKARNVVKKKFECASDSSDLKQMDLSRDDLRSIRELASTT